MKAKFGDEGIAVTEITLNYKLKLYYRRILGTQFYYKDTKFLAWTLKSMLLKKNVINSSLLIELYKEE